MKPLPDILKKNGFQYTKVCQVGRSYIFRQRLSASTACFEVFRARIYPEQEFNGKSYPERHVFPSNECFGISAWSYRNYEDALKRIQELKKQYLDD